jgi:hypothetical protein
LFFCDSLILNDDERFSLIALPSAKKSELLYRGSRDGFTPPAMHSKCDDRANLVSIIQSNTNYIFGAYTSVPWNSTSAWITDPNAFIHSIRRNGISKTDKFMIKPNVSRAFFGSAQRGGDSIFYYKDIIVYNQSNTTVRSTCNLGCHYQLPEGTTAGSAEAINFLAGNHNQWLTTEIEVYQIQ